jgi:2,3,4,5-tetrahydropyridine-2-carboxylate N-succinyltransferase
VVVRAERKREFPGGDFYLPCALIIRRLQSGERSHLNEILRDSGVAVS